MAFQASKHAHMFVVVVFPQSAEGYVSFFGNLIYCGNDFADLVGAARNFLDRFDPVALVQILP